MLKRNHSANSLSEASLKRILLCSHKDDCFSIFFHNHSPGRVKMLPGRILFLCYLIIKQFLAFICRKLKAQFRAMMWSLCKEQCCELLNYQSRDVRAMLGQPTSKCTCWYCSQEWDNNKPCWLLLWLFPIAGKGRITTATCSLTSIKIISLAAIKSALKWFSLEITKNFSFFLAIFWSPKKQNN